MSKTKKVNNTSENQNEELTKEQLINLFEATSKIYEYAMNRNPTTTFTPQLTNERLSSIGTGAAGINGESLKNAVSNPSSPSSQNALVGFSEWLAFTNAIARRTMGYYGNMLSWDWTYKCTNITDAKEYASAEYKADLRKFEEIMDRLDVKREFSFAYRRSLAADAFFAVLRTDGENYVFQELPNDFCLITGKDLDYGYVFDFDLTWFLYQGLSINSYPKAFRQMWRRVYGDADIDSVDPAKYNPSNPINQRTGKYATWSQTSPLLKNGGFTCFKFNTDLYASIPFMTTMFRDAMDTSLYRELAKNSSIIAAQKLVVGLIPMLKETKGGQVRDAFALSPAQLGNYLGLLKAGLTDAIKVAGVPFSDVKDITFAQPTTNAYEKANEILSTKTGVTSRLIYGGTDRMSATEVVYNAEIDEMICKAVYPQYAKWLSTFINSQTSKYKFKITFEGSKFSSARKARQESVYKLADRGIVDFQKIAAANDMSIFELKSHLEESANNDGYQSLWKNLRLLPNTNTVATTEMTGGRPTVDVPSDSRERSDDYNGGE